jgi:hypothetical protein
MERLKHIGALFLGFLILLAVVVVIGLLLGAAEWLSLHVLPWFVRGSAFCLLFLVVVLLPLSLIRKCRTITSSAMLFISFVFGATLWMDGLLVTLSIWGDWAVIIGLCFAGVGVVPIAMLATLFHGMWAALGELAFLAVLTFGTRVAAFWIGEKTTEPADGWRSAPEI